MIIAFLNGWLKRTCIQGVPEPRDTTKQEFTLHKLKITNKIFSFEVVWNYSFAHLQERDKNEIFEINFLHCWKYISKKRNYEKNCNERYDPYLLIVIAATERRLTPTFPYLKKGTRTQKNRTSAQLASTNLMESKGNTRRQNTKSATQRL